MADSVLAVHFLYVLGIIIPAFLIPFGARRGWKWIHNRPLRITHFAMMGIVLAESIAGVMCPLTWLEDSLRGKNSGGFIEFWAHRILFHDFPPWIFGALYALLFAVIVAEWYLVPPTRAP